MIPMIFKCFATLSLMIAVPALMAVETKPKQTLKLQSEKSVMQSARVGTNEAKNEVGVIDEDAEIEGITIINGNVSIDGVKVAHGVRMFRSTKTGRSYRIDWGKGGNVSVIEQ